MYAPVNINKFIFIIILAVIVAPLLLFDIRHPVCKITGSTGAALEGSEHSRRLRISQFDSKCLSKKKNFFFIQRHIKSFFGPSCSIYTPFGPKPQLFLEKIDNTCSGRLRADSNLLAGSRRIFSTTSAESRVKTNVIYSCSPSKQYGYASRTNGRK